MIDMFVEADHRHDPRTVRPMAWAAYLTLGVVAIVTYYLLPQAGVAQAVLIMVVNATSAFFGIRAATKTRGGLRIVWASLGIAMTLETLANGPYYAYPLVTGHHLPFPAPVDVLFLACYPCYAVALIALARQRRREDWRGDALDVAILVVAGGSLMWTFLIAPVVRASGLDPFAHAVAIAYPAMDLLVFAFLVRVVVAVAWRSGAMRLLLTSFIVLLAGDALYAIKLSNGTYQFGGPVDAFWMLSYLLIGVAALHPTSREFTRSRAARGLRISRGRLAFLIGAVLSGPILMTTQPHNVVAIAASAVCFVLVMARLTGLNRLLALTSVELETRASTDSLTGLANRAMFYTELEAVLNRPARRGVTHAVLFVDLDDFKDVNDSLGHAIGDAVLQIVADRLRSSVRAGDLVARLGGDEFALLLIDIPDANSALGLAERAVQCLALPAEIHGNRVHVGASIGLSIPRDDSDPISVMREADVAMYTSKSNGKNRVTSYDHELDRALGCNNTLKADVLHAAARGELVIDYQPVVELHSGRMAGVEALVRWQHPTFGLLPPLTFIGLAEETGAIVEMGAWVLETACWQVLSWQQRHVVPGFSLSVNVSMRQLDQPGFAARVIDILEKTGFDPALLIVEITESVLADPSGGTADSLQELRALGVRVAIDDFGTGYSSIGYLRQLPVDVLKIDRSFVSGAQPGHHSEDLLDAIVGLGQRLGLEVVPEGIEETAQLVRLQDLGCRIGQGFLLSRPLSPTVIDTLLRHTAPVPADA